MMTKLFTKLILTFASFVLIVMMLASSCNSPLETAEGDDGSLWQKVNQPGFGDEDNSSVVAMAEYQGRLYAMTRNEVEGVEVWRTNESGWEQVRFPESATNGIYGNTWINNLWGGMIVFQDKLYCGFSSGLQGSVLKSTGCEIWRYDGERWEPVISDKKDSEASGSITSIAGCEEDDGDITARITDNTKSWVTDEWAGGVLQITSGEGSYRRFDIISNTSDVLTVQQNEVAGNVGSEYTICGMQEYSNSFPPYEYELGEIREGDNYEIGTGVDENGFGDYWNKTITKLYLFDGKLYVSTGLNYEYGAQVWYTEDGDSWAVIEPANTFGIYHDDPGYPDSQKPVSTSIGSLSAFTVSDTEVLYAGGAGSSGSAGMCSRVAKLTASGWEPIVDTFVDDNDTGTNENGFGDGLGCTLNTGNFLPWSLASFGNKLLAGIQSLGGARVLYTTNGSAKDGSWLYSVGGDGSLPAGFDGAVNGGIPSMFQNVAVNLFPFENHLYAGLVATYAPATGATEEYLTGSHIWRTKDGINWQPVTLDGFGDDYVVGFEAFATFDGKLYVSGSKGASSSTEGLGGAEIFRLISPNSDSGDWDGVPDVDDNCPETPNGPDGGTCAQGTYLGDPCTVGGVNASECGDDGFCSMDQEDTDSDGVGDVCDGVAHFFPPLSGALNAMESDSVVTVSEVTLAEWEEGSNFFYAFESNQQVPTTGFIIYPGAWLDPRGYAPPAHTIAAEGYLVVIVKMPGDLAITRPYRANEIMLEYPEIEKWIIGGHSLGGSSACAYAKEFPDKVDGVVLWASYPSENYRLDDTDLKAISIYGTNDGHPEKIEAGAEHLPADAEFVPIEGGNHTQFGWYDTSPNSIQDYPSPNPAQEGDNPADITREEQQAIIISETLDFLEQF
jgi:hypothetical protein